MNAKPVCPQCRYFILNKHLNGLIHCSNCGWKGEMPLFPSQRGIDNCPECGFFTLKSYDKVSCARCNWRVWAITHIAQEPITSIPIDIC